MFDVPPPYDGCAGSRPTARSGRRSSPGRPAWAVFEIVSLEVVAGSDVAFAYALMRCDTADGLARNPDNRLRVTLGLRKQDGRWIITHEHHSFPIS